MNLHKILKYVAALIGVAGVIFLIRIISKGDDAIKAAAVEGDTAIVDPFAWMAYIILGLTVAFVVFFVIKNLFTNTNSLKSTLLGLGLFLGVLVIAYVFSTGDDITTHKYMYDGKLATSKESHMVGAGLIAFYVLIIGAAGAMLLSGVKKMINR